MLLAPMIVSGQVVAVVWCCCSCLLPLFLFSAKIFFLFVSLLLRRTEQKVGFFSLDFVFRNHGKVLRMSEFEVSS